MSNENERQSWNRKIIEEFRANAGAVAEFGGTYMVLLHHTGAKSGTAYVSPLVGFPQAGGGWAIVASNGGRDQHPSWYHNLQASPDTVLEVPGDGDVRTVKVSARIADEGERDTLYAGVVATAPQFGEYQKATSRRIPIMVLDAAA
jgi:deazaflavin-dependent oxidoreductase (nitroreductase family)